MADVESRRPSGSSAARRARACRCFPAFAALLGIATAAAGEPRLSNGKPDLSGTYDTATVTPLQRPEMFGDTLYLTPEQARTIVGRNAARKEGGAQRSDPNRGAPPVGGDGSTGAAGNVGGYNTFWIDNGDSAFMIDGRYRTSIITEPKNGRQPDLTPDGRRRGAALMLQFRENTGDAWWVDLDGPGPYDGPEARTLSDRCLLGFGSTGGPPMLPTLYNNLKRIVQTPDYVMILVEMVHDARVVRMNARHVAPEIRRWLGDSIGWWDGETLVVETTNFTDTPALALGTRALKVTERFRRADDGSLIYSFVVDDPNTWSAPWGGEYPWPATDDRVYEYACHEGNYAMEGMLKGARMLEADALAPAAGSD